MSKPTSQIPQPPALPFLGNLSDIDMEFPLGSMIHLADKYGPIYRIKLGDSSMIVVSSYEYVAEMSDEERFKKSIEGELDELRNVVHDGLFTSKGPEEENWGIAHRVLMSAFGPLAIRGMFDEMHDISSQLALKWARQGPATPIQLGEDFTRLALDTLALCSMGFRFNSYYRESLHPFIAAMYATLKAAGKKTARVLPSVFYRSDDKEYKGNIKFMRATAEEVLRTRKKNPEEYLGRKDLLGAMLDGVDKVTGKKMTDQSIVDNLITFLVAGHETTASTLTFVVYQLLMNPEAYRKAQNEVDAIVGTGPIRVEDVSKLKYINAVIRETLRHSAPITGLGREPIKDEVLGGKYKVKAGETVVSLFAKSHFDAAVWGNDAQGFNPDRMYEDEFDRFTKKYPHAWKPFGTGIRSCIGRPFAWQEMVLCLAMLLQNFNFVMDNPSYKLRVAQTLTIKPKDLYVRAILREGLTPSKLEARLAGSYVSGGAEKKADAKREGGHDRPKSQNEGGKPMAVFYGSNSGTCEFMAHRIAGDAAMNGFSAKVDILDAAREALPTDRPVVIVTSTYEGQPTSNAAHFVDWVQSLKGNELKDVSYIVYGCGHSDWASTYQRIPTLIDQSLEKHGASRISTLQSTNAKDRDMFSDFEAWEDATLWPSVKERFGGSEETPSTDAGLSFNFSAPRASILRQDVQEAEVTETKCLVPEGAGRTAKHTQFQLPSGMAYAAGDYLAVLPHNPKDIVSRAMRRFGLAWDAHVTIQGIGSTSLPMNTDIPVSNVLSAYVELSQVATKRNISSLCQFTKNNDTTSQLEALAADLYDSQVRSRKLSVLDIMERFSDISIPFSMFLQMLPPMRVRQYSISSSPLSDPTKATVSYDVLDEPSLKGSGRHIGVASNYLASLAPGDRVQLSVRRAPNSFHLPTNAEKTPIICIAAGTGIAPFRSFFQERHILLQSGKSLAPALFFIGCRDPDSDELYREEFDSWEAAGGVKIFRAYSRKPEKSDGCHYVQDRMWAERQALAEMYDLGAKFYVCGSNKMANGVKDMCLKIARELFSNDGEPMSEDDSQKWFDSMRSERYATDVFD